MAKYEVQPGRTVSTLMGTAHEGAKLTLDNFSGQNDKQKQMMIDELVKIGCLKEAPLSEEEKRALAEVEEIRAKAKEEAEAKRQQALEKVKAEAEEKEAAEEKKKCVILEADFDNMNKQPMIDFAEENEIELKGSKAEEIRDELKALQESLTAPE